MAEGLEQSGKNDINPPKSPSREILGLGSELWRVAILLGLAQFSVGLWNWQFSVHLDTFLEPWQIGLTYSSRPVAMLLGGYLSGMMADFFGRRKTMAFSLVPISFGLLTLSFYPIWPTIPIQFGLVMFGISSVRLMQRAIPADVVEAERSQDPARKFMMIMVPLWIMDGISPLIGTFLLSIGLIPQHLYLIAAIGGVLACLAVILGIKESLAEEIIEKAKQGPRVPIRSLGRNFWIFSSALVSYFFFYSSAISYLGVLCVDEWGVDITVYGISWSLFSFTSALIMYPVSGLADRNLKAALIVAVLGNGLSFIGLGFGSGDIWLYVINIIWAFPFMLWLGSVRSIIANSVPEDLKGRAFGTYDMLAGLTAMFAASFGALLWQISGSLRLVWILAGSGMILVTFVVAFVLQRIEISQGPLAA
ncbi:MAG: MFS transporter [Candidatus Thorarchaeota archaeon]|jgi:MFS family permease